MNKVLIRADSSSQIGTGHIMRDLVLTQQFTKSQVSFACLDLAGNINAKIQENGYKLYNLKTSKVEELINIIKSQEITTLVIDHYGIDYHDEKQIKEKTGVEIFVLDDTYEKHHCDILLNHNVYADTKRYENCVPKGCELRCGMDYTLLRQEFIEEKNKKRQIQKYSCLLVMGGADSANLNVKILKVLAKFPNIIVHVVTTTANQYLTELMTYIKDKVNVKVHINSNKMAQLMRNSDFAIATPSVTLNEVIFMGLDFIAIKTADNQDEMIKYLEEIKLPLLIKFSSMHLQYQIEYLLNKDEIILVEFNELSKIEKKMTLNWRNSSSVRNWMFTKEKINYKDHHAFIESLKNNKRKKYFLVRKQGVNIGVIDFTHIDQSKASANIGIYSNPDLSGVGKYLLKALVDYAFLVLKVKTLISEAYVNNSSAIKLYEKFLFKNIGSRIYNHEKVIIMELTNENW